ncbi:MAG TPA: cysteine--tRNA ligase [Acidimicrobiia bacterium]
MLLFDTAAREKVEFEPRVAGQVSMYVCGPTPYDSPHVGHGRTAVVFDTMRRYLTWRGNQVSFVSNVTDVEDRIIARAAERGTTEPELAHHFEDEHWEQMGRLGVLRPDEAPHATEFIPQMLTLIGELVDAGRAYVIEDSGVYFQVDTLPSYGALSHRTLEQLLESAGARIAVDDEKRSPIDFALWKAAKPGEPEWDSPWGRGRPGWHIECSAMSLEILGEGFDIHGGGDDLVFPHHENEIAQAEGAGHEFARYWLHSGMVTVSGEKMSKSLGNFTTLKAALDAHGPRAFRWLVASTHYHRQMEINDDALRAAKAAIDGFDALARRARIEGVVVDPPATAGEVDGIDAFRDAMDDDFDTPAAIAVLHGWRSEANAAIDAGRLDEARAALARVASGLGAIGLALDDGSSDASDDDGAIDELVRARDAARAAKDWPEADRLRDALEALGIVLEDTAQGTVWRRA